MRNFSFYFKKGFALTKVALKGKSFFNKLLLGFYLLVSFYGKLIFFLRPIFLIADNNLAAMVVEGHDFEITKIFEGINVRRRYSSLLLSTLFVDAIVLGAAIAMVVPFYVWQATNLYSPNLKPLIFIIAMGAAVLALVVVLAIMFAPQGYVTARGKDLNAGDILFLSKEGSKGIKGKIVGLNLLHHLFILLAEAVLIVGAYVFLLIASNNLEMVVLFTAITAILLIALAVVEILVLPIFRLSLLNSLYSLYYDSVEVKHIVVASKGGDEEEYEPLFTDDKEEK